MSAPRVPSELSAELSRLTRAEQTNSRLPSLSAAVFDGREIVWSEAVGLADVENGIETTLATQYRVGSITKTFTAACVMALRDDGLLSLDDSLAQHVPEAPLGEATLRRLLAHASGLQREFPGAMWEELTDLPREELLTSIADAEQILEPGAHWHYSNLAFALLGEVIERRSGMAWEHFVDERFLVPLGLSRTGLEASPPAARGYLVDPYQEAAELEGDIVLRRGAAAGQLWSTTSDIARWGAFLADPDPNVLAPATVDQMHSVQVMAEPERWTLAWGLGLALRRQGDRILVGHGGAVPGHLAHFLYSRTERIGAVVFANSSVWPRKDDFILELATRALQGLAGEREVWRPAEPAPPELAALLGRWWTEGSEFVLRHRAGRLEAKLVDEPDWYPPSIFEPDGEDRFRVASGRERGELLRVVRDERGETVKLYWATYPCTRTPTLWGPQGPKG